LFRSIFIAARLDTTDDGGCVPLPFPADTGATLGTTTFCPDGFEPLDAAADGGEEFLLFVVVFFFFFGVFDADFFDAPRLLLFLFTAAACFFFAVASMATMPLIFFSRATFFFERIFVISGRTLGNCAFKNNRKN
jgi:hypothetical protein